MDILKITSISNQHCQRIRRLGTAKDRRLEKAFLAEGKRLLGEAVMRGWRAQLLVIAEEDYLAGHYDEKSQLMAAADHIVLMPKSLIDRIAPTDSSQGCIGVFSVPKIQELETFLREFNVFILLDGISDPGNLGTLLRSAAAFSCGVLLSHNCADVWAPKVVRSSMGAVFRNGFYHLQNNEELANILGKNGIPIYAASAGGRDVASSILPRRCCFVLGNEAHGLSPYWGERTLLELAVPMAEGSESLNVAVAGSILLYEWQRQGKLQACGGGTL